MSGGGGGAAREQMFPDGCTCTSYGHGLLMTRVTSYTCPIHAAEQPRVSGAEPPPAPSEADKQPESPLRAHQGEQVTASASLAAAVSAVPAQAAADHLATLLRNPHYDFTMSERQVVAAALDALLAQLNEADFTAKDRDSWRMLADSSRKRAERAEAEAERLREALRFVAEASLSNEDAQTVYIAFNRVRGEARAALAGGAGT